MITVLLLLASAVGLGPVAFVIMVIECMKNGKM